VVIIKSCGINNGYTTEVDTEQIIKSAFDMELEGIEFTISEENRNYYAIMTCRNSIGKCVLNVSISNLNGTIISEHKYYICPGLYHFDSGTKKVYIFVDDELRGYIGNVVDI